MNIAYISNTDLPGKVFNGYNLHKTLNNMGYNCNQVVLEKYSTDDTVLPLLSQNELFIRSELRILEQELGMNAMLFPYSKNLTHCKAFNMADIVHYQLIHNSFLSIDDLKSLFKLKKSVWTIHDPWVITGHCIHPLSCDKWTCGCNGCTRLNEGAFPLNIDNASLLWKIKRELFRDLDIDIVVSSNFMINYLKKSPITCNLKRIHKIPFGIELNGASYIKKEEAKKRLNIDDNNVVISFRNEIDKIKGVKYIEEALLSLEDKNKITILTVGEGNSLDSLKRKYDVIELGWQNDSGIMDDFYSASDVFLMPSLAESFGMMAIEAMAHCCTVVVFKDTVLEEITYSPECGIAVKYKSTEELKNAVVRVIKDENERFYRGKLGREIVSKYYKYSDYINSHIDLYEEILSRKEGE